MTRTGYRPHWAAGISHRHWLAAAAAAVTIVPRHVLGGLGQTPPSEKLNIAGVGIGSRGREDLAEVNSQNIIALADVGLGLRRATPSTSIRGPGNTKTSRRSDKSLKQIPSDTSLGSCPWLILSIG